VTAITQKLAEQLQLSFLLSVGQQVQNYV